MTIKDGSCKPAQLSMEIQTVQATTVERAESAQTFLSSKMTQE